MKLIRTCFLITVCWVAPALAAEYPAQIDWSQRAILSMPVSGVIRQVAVRPGQAVQAGQLLVQLDQRPFAIAVREAQAQVHKHALARDEERRQLQRTRELYDRRVISLHDLQVEEIATASAESDYTSASAALDRAQLDLEYSTLHAPFAGIALEVPVVAGMTIVNTQQVTPLVTLVQSHPMLARVQLPGAVPGGLQAGQTATVSVDKARFSGRLVTVDPKPGGGYLLTVSFDPGDSQLEAGLPAQVELQ